MKYAILGAGGMARELREILIDNGNSIDDLEFFVDTPFVEGNLNAKDISTLNPRVHQCIIAVGDSSIREKWFREVNSRMEEFETILHHSVLCGTNVSIGQGGIVAAQCHLTCDIVLGEFCQLNLQTTISHDCVIGDFFTSAPKVSITGNVKIGTHVFVGSGATILPGISICDNVIIGAGSVVTKDITTPGTYIGVPAKPIL